MAALIPLIVPTLTVASAGLGVAAAAGAFKPDTPEPPSLGDAAGARKQAALMAQRRRGFQSTILGDTRTTEPTLGTPTVLGVR